VTRFYPVSLALEGRRSVVIGGGRIATDKVKGLLEAGARVTVIAPELSPTLETLVESGAVRVERRAYRPGDLAGAFIAIAATDDREANRRVWGEAEARGVLLNAVDDVDHCHFIAPAIHRRGDLTVAVSTGGKSPAVAARLRDRIGASIGPEYEPWLELLGSLRDEIARRVPETERRREVWYRIADSEARVLLARGDLAGARARIDAIVARTEPHLPAARRDGPVYLVGAGPGDPDLITSRGLALLRAAEVVVYDRLIDERLLTEAPPWAERISVTDGGADAEGRQAWVNEILIQRARAGFSVVRLKGGDPFVFGRGGEEIVALRAAGIRYQVVPGVTSAVAAPGAAEIPVTHRDLSSGFAVITAQGKDGAEPAADWDAIARVPTIVVLMGLGALSQVAKKLIAAGRAPETPAAVVSRATRRDGRTVLGTLATIAAAASAARLAAPATLIIGDVVRLAPNADQLIASPAVSGARHGGEGGAVL
jgi:uroporphyrin-III C-methyltransferase/precorrin-2 dehydrogenase/sirohydrochlorin ferrochelatase